MARCDRNIRRTVLHIYPSLKYGCRWLLIIGWDYSICTHLSTPSTLTLWRPLLPYMDTAINYPVPDRVKPSFCNFWHLGTLTWTERQSARMSKITNDGLPQSSTGCVIAIPIWQQWASKGQIKSLSMLVPYFPFYHILGCGQACYRITLRPPVSPVRIVCLVPQLSRKSIYRSSQHHVRFHLIPRHQSSSPSTASTAVQLQSGLVDYSFNCSCRQFDGIIRLLSNSVMPH